MIVSVCECVIVCSAERESENERKARVMRSTTIVSTAGLAKKAMKEAEEARLAAEVEAGLPVIHYDSVRHDKSRRVVCCSDATQMLDTTSHSEWCAAVEAQQW